MLDTPLVMSLGMYIEQYQVHYSYFIGVTQLHGVIGQAKPLTVYAVQYTALSAQKANFLPFWTEV